MTVLLASAYSGPSLRSTLALRLGREAQTFDAMRALGAMLLAAHDLARGKPLKLGDGLAGGVVQIAVYPDFAGPVRALPGECTATDRGLTLTSMDGDGVGHAARWLYLDLLAPAEVAELAASYNLLPYTPLTQTWIARAPKALAAKVTKALGAQYGADTDDPPTDVGVRVADFEVAGKVVKLWASPEIGALIDRAPWKP